MATLNAYIDKLRKVQQEYIVYCMLEFGGREDFHRGLLPFLDVHEAARVLNRKIECIKEGLPDAEAMPIFGEKFIRGIISVFADEIAFKVCEGEISETLQVSDKRLGFAFPNRYGRSFYIKLLNNVIAVPKSLQLVHMQWIKPDTWKFTCHPKVRQGALYFLRGLQ